MASVPKAPVTGDEHAARARDLLTPVYGEGDRLGHTDAVFLAALRGIGHALLAIHAQQELADLRSSL